MKTYVGYRAMEAASDGSATTRRCVVQVVNRGKKRPLRIRHDIAMKSEGFEWGYGGSGPAQLAIALIADACGRRHCTAAIYRRVKFGLIGRLPADGWTITEQQVRDAVESAYLTLQQDGSGEESSE